jgi:hypothetical protein
MTSMWTQRTPSRLETKRGSPVSAHTAAADLRSGPYLELGVLAVSFQRDLDCPVAELLDDLRDP